MNKKEKNSIINWTTSEVMKGRTTGLISSIQDKFGLSRPTVSKIVKEMIERQWLAKSGPRNKPVYSLGKIRRIIRAYKRENIDEQEIWETDFSNYLNLSDNVKNIAHHGFTEMMNNAHDHSNAKNVVAVAFVSERNLTLAIYDDGIGIFKKIADALELPDRRLALLELSKGKFTTDPERHSGEGIFFTSRMFHVFMIKANDLEYVHFERLGDDYIQEDLQKQVKNGTAVVMQIPLDSKRTAREVFEQFTLDHPDDLSFNKTVVPVRLASLENENLVSRSQAKRLVSRFEGFKKVVLDFADITEIGQAFADEVFRVFGNAHPEVTLEVENASDYVVKMIRRVTGK